MTYEEVFSRLRKVRQEHVLEHWEILNASQKERIVDQVLHLDLSRFHEQSQLVAIHTLSSPELIEPFVDGEKAGDQERRERGRSLIAEGKVGCLVLSGGQGTRLSFAGPKGLFPITLVKRKSLYQLVADKVVAASRQVGLPLHVAFMTSSLNDEEVRTAFTENDFYGLSEGQAAFFQQGNYPILCEEGKMFLEGPATVAEGPNGNGDCLSAFIRSGLFDRWVDAGIRYLHVIQIDNPLANPFDAEMIGLHAEKGVDVVLKCIEREDPEEKVGLVVRQERAVYVKEYFELPSSWVHRRDQEGKLVYRMANLTLMTIAMDFFARAEAEGPLPLHKAHKMFQRWFPSQKDVAFAVQAWKFETFLFDILPYTDDVALLMAPRETCFAPLKNATGKHSIREVQEALEHRDRKVFREITGEEPPDHPFELDPSFYYPTPEILREWKGKPAPSSEYIES